MQQKAIVIHPVVKAKSGKIVEALTERSFNSKLDEAKSLAHAIDLKIVSASVVHLKEVSPASFLKHGKIEELAIIVEDEAVDLVIINTDITPIQQRNLEKELKTKVIDRTALILEIFGRRASTSEGKLQVELAAYEYQKSRLVRSWTHLERQRGGGGFLGGPGESQIESDRRAIKEHIAKIKKQLAQVVKTRELHRKSRKKVPYKIVALVGYTNAGKSTLFNHLTKESVLAEDMLFATLDPKIRVLSLPSGTKIMISDTVGFISDLPTQLVAAFRATLEEVVEADILLHVRDVSHSETVEQKKDVMKVLTEIGAEDKTMIEVLNKTDLLSVSKLNKFAKLKSGKRVKISALTGDGVDELLEKVDAIVNEDNVVVDIKTSIADGKILAWLYENGTVISKEIGDDEVTISASLSHKKLGYLQKMGYIDAIKEPESF